MAKAFALKGFRGERICGDFGTARSAGQYHTATPHRDGGVEYVVLPYRTTKIGVMKTPSIASEIRVALPSNGDVRRTMFAGRTATVNARLMLIALLALLIPSVVVAQTRSQQRARGNIRSPSVENQVFPPNPQAIETKRRTVSLIDNVTESARRPPNVVLILADDLGYADTGIYGSKTIPTPHIDALGNSGMRFTNAYVTAGSCSPSRAGLLSGRYQQRFGFEFNTSTGAITHRFHRGLDPAVVTLADVLQQAGYRTGMFGKWHLGTQPHLHPQARGFEEFYGFLAGAHSFFPGTPEEPIHTTVMRGHDPIVEAEYLTDAIARETVSFIDRNHDRPFFAYVPFNAVHTPIEASKKYQDRFHAEQNDKQRDYNAMTSALDDAVGAIVGALEKNQLTEKTLLIFINDNGGPMYTGVQSNGPLKLGKLFLFEGGIRVPLIVKWPAVVQPGTVFAGTTSSLDLFPTICAAAKIELPDQLKLDGTNLIPVLTGQSQQAPHQTLFWSNGPNMAVRSGDWKLVKSHDSVWLFDLASDEAETRNLAETRPEVVRQLQQAYDDWRREMLEPAWPSKPRREEVQVDGLTYQLNI